MEGAGLPEPGDVTAALHFAANGAGLAGAVRELVLTFQFVEFMRFVDRREQDQ